MKLYRFMLWIILLAACAPVPTAAVLPPAAPTLTEPPAADPSTATTAPQVEATTQPTTAQAETAAPIQPACTAPASLTHAATEGPYYSTGSPERSSLVDDLPGTRLILTGYVLDGSCQPVAGAWLDFWQADSQGAYDNAGYTLRGHQFTAEDGSYRLETVVPGLYPGRTEHIHVKVQAPGGAVLTTQLYFPGVPQNEGDGIYDPALLIEVLSADAEEMRATFNFIVSTSG